VRKAVILTLLVLLAVGGAFAREDPVTLDEAIKGSMSYLVERLSPGTIVAVLNFSADPEVSKYVIGELTAFLVNDGNLIVVDRSELESKLLEGETDFQFSGVVNEKSQQSIGQSLGAQTIISGELTPLGARWRMRVKAIEVETRRNQGMPSYTVKRDAVLSGLFKGVAKLREQEDARQKAEARRAARLREQEEARQKKEAQRQEQEARYEVWILTTQHPGFKVGAGFLNLALGTGSFIMGDWGGGLTLLAGYAAAGALVGVELGALERGDALAGVLGPIGVGVAGISAVYGFIRPFIYHKSMRTTFIDILDRVNIAITPNATGIQTVGLSYTYQY
jgi:hypothetical protein